MNNDYIYGVRAVIEAIELGKPIDKILLKSGMKGDTSSEIIKLAKANKIPLKFVPLEKLNRITRKNHQGVICFISPIEYSDIEEIVQMTFEQGKTPFVLILDGVTDVRNFGAIARTAECAGVNAIIIKAKGSVSINSDAVKTSAGALFKIPVCRVDNLVTTVKYLKNSGLNIVSASEKGSVFYYEHDFTAPCAIIMGDEGRGISLEMLKISDKVVKIPILGKIESLNVANAASIIMYDVVRQRSGN